MKEEDFAKNLIKFAEKLKRDRTICLALTDAEKYDIAIDMFLSALLKTQKLKGVYVSLNKEYGQIGKRLKSMDIDDSQLQFIDGISKVAEDQIKASRNMYLSGLKSLTEISFEITNAINSGGFDFLFMDSLSTLLVYNDPKTTEMFCHYLINKLRSHQAGGILLCLKEDKEAEKLIPIISQFCDDCIEAEFFF